MSDPLIPAISPSLPPRVLHIGQRKTATTWLQKLAEDASGAGALNFQHWGIVRLVQGRRGDLADDDLDRLAALLPQDRGRPSLATCEGMMLVAPERLATAVAQVWPDARILITTRAPQAYLMSSFNNDSFTGSRKAQDFTRAFSQNHLPGVFDFDRRRQVFEAAFGPGAVHFLPWELLRHDPPAYMAALARVLGTDLARFAPAQAINVSPPPEYLLLQRRVNAMIAEQAPGILKSADWQAFIRMANFSAGSASGLDSYFADFFRGAPAMAGDLPRLPDEVMASLAAGMTVLRDLPLYQPWLPLYGLSAPTISERS